MRKSLRFGARGKRARRGIALFIALFFVAGVGALALSAIYLTATATLLGKTYDKEDDLKYAVEAALAIGKANVNYNPSALPLTGFDTLMLNQPVKTADGSTVPGVTVTLYGGPTGSTTGQYGRFASLVAVAKDLNGTGFVRRLELSQESFAKYAYWTNNEGVGISFGGGDQIWGPVWSNDTIDILSTRAGFHDAVGTAGIITHAGYGDFDKGYAIKQKPIPLPSTASLSTLSALASAGGMNISPKTTGDETTLQQRIEFIALDILDAHDSTADNDGFFRVYQLDQTGTGDVDWLRGDWPGSNPSKSQLDRCGDWHKVAGFADYKFFPLAAHYHSSGSYTWFDTLMAKAATTGSFNTRLSNAKSEADSSVQTLMQHNNARCFLGGDPHLVAVSRTNGLGYLDTLIHKGGDDTTFTPRDPHGHWVLYPSTPNAQVTTARPNDARYLYPLYRGYNTGTKGVIYVNGTVGVSGVLRGAVTLYSPYTVVLLDDLRYINDPAKGRCLDILGVIAGKNVVVADNAVNTPQNIKPSTPALYKTLDDNVGVTIQSVIMALNTSFGVEHYSIGPSNGTYCDGNADDNGRGCLYLTGGVIQKTRGAVGNSLGYGFSKRYSYDRCAVVNPPPYFPTTGRYGDNRYFEIDPVKFDPAKLFQQISPH